MTNMVLVKYEDDWADEMTIRGFKVMGRAEWEDFRSRALRCLKPGGEYEYSVGTNEEVTFDDGEDLLDHLEVSEIDDVQAGAILKAFGLDEGEEFGFFPEIDAMDGDDDDGEE